MKKALAFLLLCTILYCSNAKGQLKITQHRQQLWYGYLNQTRLTNRWGIWLDLHLRTLDDYTDQYSQSLARTGLTYFFKENKRITTGYTWSDYYPADNHKKIAQIEHRPWQQFVTQKKYGTVQLKHTFRSEQRFRQRVLNDSTLANTWTLQHRFRYAIATEIPLSKKATPWSAVISNEMMFQMNQSLGNGMFDQDRVFVGLQYKATPQTQFQAGYMHILQKGNQSSYKEVNVIRLYMLQQIDLRKKRP